MRPLIQLGLTVRASGADWVAAIFFRFFLALAPVESDPEARRASVVAGRQVDRSPFSSWPAFRDDFY
jgi:hypothetical protein